MKVLNHKEIRNSSFFNLIEIINCHFPDVSCILGHLWQMASEPSFDTNIQKSCMYSCIYIQEEFFLFLYLPKSFYKILYRPSGFSSVFLDKIMQ